MNPEHFSHYTDPVPPELVAAARNGRLLLLVGAGTSRTCLDRNRQPLPSWGELLSRIVEWLSSEERLDLATQRDLRDLLVRDEHLVVAEELISQGGPGVVQEYLQATFDPSMIVPSRRHELLASLPARGIVTTNYDNLLERAYVAVHKRQPNVLRVDQRSRWHEMGDDVPFVLKLHGDIEEPESIILGFRSYRDLLQSADYDTLMRDLMSNHTALIVGSSLRDADILRGIDYASTIRSSPEEPNHFLLSRRGERSEVEKRRLLLDRGVKVIEYVDYFDLHNHVDTFLEWLHMEIDGGRAMAAVADHMWFRVSIHFPPECQADGRFLADYLFKNGAAGAGLESDGRHLAHLPRTIEDRVQCVDYAFVMLSSAVEHASTAYGKLVLEFARVARDNDVQLVFMVVGDPVRPRLLATEGIQAPVFYVPNGFSESDLVGLRAYIEQDLRAGYRQP